MVVIQSVIMEEDDDLEALRLAALQTIRPRVNPKKTQHRQHAKGPFIRPITNPNLIAIVPSEIAPVPVETKTPLPPPPPPVVKPKQEAPVEIKPKDVQGPPITEVKKDIGKAVVNNADNTVSKPKPTSKHEESVGFELEEDVLDFDTESLHESGEEDLLQLHDSDSDSLEKLMEDIEKELSTPAPAKVRPPRKQADKVNSSKGKSPPKINPPKATTPPKTNQSKPKSPVKIDIKPESPKPSIHEKSSPVRKRYSPIRQRAGTPLRQRGVSPLRQRPASPSRQRMASPRQRLASPSRQRLASPIRRSPRRSPRRRSITPRKRSLSPRKISPRRRSPSPRRRSPTPRKRSLTPRRRSLSPRRRSLTPRKRSLTPRKRSLTPRKRSLTPRKRSLTPRKRSLSPRRRSISPRRRSLTPRKHSISPRRRSISPRRFSPRRFSPRRSSVSPRRRRSISPRRRSLSPWRSPRRRSPTPNKRSPSPLRKRSPSPHHSPNKRKRVQSPPNSKRPRQRPFPRGKQPPNNSSNRPVNNLKGGYRGNRDNIDKKEDERRVRGNSRERDPVRSRERGTDTNEDEEKEPEPLNPKLEARKRKFENNYVIEAVNKKIRLKSERDASNFDQNRLEKGSGGDNLQGTRTEVDSSKEEQIRENMTKRLDRLEKARSSRLEKLRNDLSRLDKPRSEPLRPEKPSLEVSKSEKFRSENSRPDPLPNIVVRTSAVELEREPNLKLRTAKRKKIVLSEDKIEVERPRESTRLSENQALKNSTNLRRREVDLEEIEEGEEDDDDEEEEEEEERIVEKKKRKAPLKEKGGDLRAELSRRRAERMKGVSMDPMARIVQSAFEGVVGKMKSKSRASPPSDPEPVPQPPPEKKDRSRPKGRRVFSVSKSSKTADKSDDEDKNIGFPMHYRGAPNPSPPRTSGRSILRRNQV